MMARFMMFGIFLFFVCLNCYVVGMRAISSWYTELGCLLDGERGQVGRVKFLFFACVISGNRAMRANRSWVGKED